MGHDQFLKDCIHCQQVAAFNYYAGIDIAQFSNLPSSPLNKAVTETNRLVLAKFVSFSGGFIFYIHFYIILAISDARTLTDCKSSVKQVQTENIEKIDIDTKLVL